MDPELVPHGSELPLVPLWGEAADLFTPEARALIAGRSRLGKTPALDMTRAQLNAAGILYEEVNESAGNVGFRLRPAGPIAGSAPQFPVSDDLCPDCGNPFVPESDQAPYGGGYLIHDDKCPALGE
ncbi:hypothetical protein [Streptomyces sp. NPDC053541]|uniref:hypothetical protein n=1 Tax=Streptomyces sp. NPDC053541 TaxID=3365709 RepID=UPI0037D6ED3C